MKILVTGFTGLLGAKLVSSLQSAGHEVLGLTRRADAHNIRTVLWDPLNGKLNAAELEGLDGLVHLAGETIVGRWNAAKKARIMESRRKGTQLLCETLAQLNRPPGVLVSASAIGYYGNRGEEMLREESAPGSGFLAQTCLQWEGATKPAMQKGIRVVLARIGVVLSTEGGALAKMLLPFKLGAGGVVGSGKQYWSWIALEDVVGALRFAVETSSLNGPVNLVAPQAVTNHEFTKTLGRVLARPTILPLPAFAARLVLGEMAEDLLLSSARIAPAKLVVHGYRFQHGELEGALRAMLI